MNMDPSQHQQYSLVSGIPAPPQGSSSANSLCTTAMSSSLNSSGEYVNVPSSYVTIGMMPPPPTSSGGSMMATNISTPNSSTTTFKTPLLPMPTLEDIEGGLGPSNTGQTGMPPGILKYPTSTSSAVIMPPPPQGMGPGPPPPPSASSMTALTSPPPPVGSNMSSHHASSPLVSAAHMSIPPPPSNLSLGPTSAVTALPTGSLVDASTCGTLKSSAKLQTPANLNAAAAASAASVSVSSSTSAPCAASAIAVPSNCTNINTPSSSTVPLNLHSTTANSSKTSSRSNLHHRPASPKCCSCFGGGGGSSSSGPNNRGGRNSTKSSSISMKSSANNYTHKKGHKGHSRRNVQTFWSAVLTNLGICALLLAYTLLGSFIFLTIESEDATLLQQQRTLASTKRNISPHLKQATSTTTGNSGGATNSNNNNNNLYHTQQQQQHVDNGTMNAIGAGYTSSSSSSASSASSSMPQMMEGMISLNNNDFNYGDDFTPQYALSPDTYDVRQRTIENIWDITVSLNILYKENWTKLAALEIAKFQDQLIKRLNEDAMVQLSHDTDVNGQTPATEAVLLFHQHGLSPHHHHHHHEWNFAKAFLYSLTVLTTIGYGNIAPRTTLGRLVTLAYAFFGIPLTLVYLSSTGGILAKVAREVFSKALCCCLCSNCGYCCYDEKRMAEKERRMKRKRQQEEMRKQQQALQEPYYVRSGSMPDNFQTPEKQSLGNASIQMPDLDSLSASESRGSMHGLAILAPILLCFCMMIIYILFGAVVLYRLEEWPLLDGIYFCFMSLSTIGFGDMMPGFRRDSNTTIWFCSIYIMSGMALTAMCFNVIHEEIVNRIKFVVEFKKSTNLDTTNDEPGYYMPP
uniref:Potassium channel domain-containing protein n=1 Tax=Stomoxys calcitrans TaxID=35570 RepID=A0A1I8Q6B6_STOCA